MIKNVNRFSLSEVIKENFECDSSSIFKKDKFYNSLDESELMQVGDVVLTESIKSTKDQLAKLNKKGTYGDLPKSKGNILKSSYYKQIKSCLNITKYVYDSAHGQTLTEAKEALQICQFAAENLERNKDYFEKAFRDNDSKMMLTYLNNAAMLATLSVILIINTMEIDEKCNMDFKEFKPGLLKKNKCFKSLEKFNDLCRNKKFPEVKKFNEKMEEYDDQIWLHEEENNFNFQNLVKKGINMGNQYLSDNPKAKKTFAVLGGIVAASGIVAALVYMSRFAIMYFYYKKNTIAQDAEYLGMVVEANSLTAAVETKKDGKVKAKQKRVSDKLNKLGKILDSDHKQAEFNASNVIKKQDTNSAEMIENDIVTDSNSNPMSNNDNLFI